MFFIIRKKLKKDCLKVKDYDNKNNKNDGNFISFLLIILIFIAIIPLIYFVSTLSSDETKTIKEEENVQISVSEDDTPESLYQNALDYSSKEEYKIAFQYFKISSDKSYTPATTMLGLMYECGTGVEKDYKEALKYYKLATEKGFYPAECYLGYLYYKGLGVGKNIEKAIKHIKNSADKGFSQAQYLLGIIYLKGDEGVDKDYNKAFYYFKLAADNVNIM